MVYSSAFSSWATAPPFSGIGGAISRERDTDQREFRPEPAHVVGAAEGDIEELSRVIFGVPVGIVGAFGIFVGVEQQARLRPGAGQRRRGADDDAVGERLRIDGGEGAEVLVEGYAQRRRALEERFFGAHRGDEGAA